MSVRDIVFNVTGSSGNDHTVSFGTNTNDTMPSCTCRDWITWNIFHASISFLSSGFIPYGIGTSYLTLTGIVPQYLSTDTIASSLNTFFDDITGSEVEKISQEEPEPVEEEEHSQDEIPKLQV